MKYQMKLQTDGKIIQLITNSILTICWLLLGIKNICVERTLKNQFGTL